MRTVSSRRKGRHGQPSTRCSTLGGVAALLLTAGLGRTPPVAAECGLPAGAPLWIDYGEGSVRPDVRAVFTKPGVVVATSRAGAIPTAFRAGGARPPTSSSTCHGSSEKRTTPQTSRPSSLRRMRSTPKRSRRQPAPPVDRAQRLQGSQLPMPGLPRMLPPGERHNARAASGRARCTPACSFMAIRPSPATPRLGGEPRRTRRASSMRRITPRKSSARPGRGQSAYANRHAESRGSVRSRRGATSAPWLMLGFHSVLTPGVAGALDSASRGVAPRRQMGGARGGRSLPSTGCRRSGHGDGTFGPETVDADKAVAACTWLWVRTQSLCDAPGIAGRRSRARWSRPDRRADKRRAFCR